MYTRVFDQGRDDRWWIESHPGRPQPFVVYHKSPRTKVGRTKPHIHRFTETLSVALHVVGEECVKHWRGQFLFPNDPGYDKRKESMEA